MITLRTCKYLNDFIGRYLKKNFVMSSKPFNFHIPNLVNIYIFKDFVRQTLMEAFAVIDERCDVREPLCHSLSGIVCSCHHLFLLQYNLEHYSYDGPTFYNILSN